MGAAAEDDVQFFDVTDTTLKGKAGVACFVKGMMQATRIMYTDKAKVMPIIVKQTGYSEKVVSQAYDFLVKNCIWDANSGLSPEQINFTAKLMEKVGNVEKGKVPTYDQIVDTQFARAALKEASAILSGAGLQQSRRRD